MGRNSTGARVCSQVNRIELSYLLKKGHLKKGEKNTMIYRWVNGHGQDMGSIALLCYWSEEEIYIRLKYTHTDGGDFDYKVRLTSVPSNLGKGEVLYFICPVSGNRCRVLYSAYGSHKFKARNAFQYRLYYSSQLSSKMNYANDRFWALDKKIKRLQATKYFKHTYNGKPTKKALKLQALRNKQNYYDSQRWGLSNMPLALRKHF
jgi:hypothetical protein